MKKIFMAFFCALLMILLTACNNEAMKNEKKRKDGIRRENNKAFAFVGNEAEFSVKYDFLKVR